MHEPESIATLAEALVAELAVARQTVATAESCTGGWIAKSLTDIAGSSEVFGYGIVSYSNAAKESLLGVDAAAIESDGAVSEEVVRQMALGALRISGADHAVAVSGIAGPGGGSEEKPVGTVWFAWAARTAGEPSIATEARMIRGDRGTVRVQTVLLALQGLRERVRHG